MSTNNKFSNTFLEKIMQLESGGGRFVNHQPADPKSMHFGTTAIGRYGLMPLTISDVVKSSKNPEFDELRQYADFSDVSNPVVSNMKQEYLKQYIKQNPMVEDLIAKEIQRKIESNVGNEDLGAVAWHAGSEASKAKLQKILKEKTDRGEKAREYFKRWSKLKSKGVPTQVPVLQEQSSAYNIPSLLNIMTSRPTVEDLLDKQAQDEVNTGLWSQLKQYLHDNYNKGNDEE